MMEMDSAIYFPSRLLIEILLLISGIEPNPGPVSTCLVCKLQFKSVQDYYDHYKIQHSDSNVPCLNEKCDYRGTTRPALQTHLSRCEFKPVKEKLVLKCPFDSCSALSEWDSIDSLKTHLESHLDADQSFECPFDNCETLQTTTSNFRSHFSRHHVAHPTHPPPSEPSTSSSAPRAARPASTARAAPASLSAENSVCPEQVSTAASNRNAYSPQMVKDAVLEFYVRLEGEHVLPSSTVQVISENIKKFSAMSHQILKRTLEKELKSLGLPKSSIDTVVSKTFVRDPVYNIHHKGCDVEQVSSIHLRKKLMKERLPYVSPVEVFLGRDNSGKAKLSHRVPVKETLETLLKDPKVKEEILKSFTLKPSEDGILRDFRDGSAFREHLKIHDKCIHLILFQDAFEHSPFGPAKGKYKTVGMYFIIGNFSPELRSKVDKILLSFLLLENHLKTTEAEELNGCNKWAEALKSLIDELNTLQLNGVTIDGENIPVCILFVAGDNLGSHQIGSFVQSFSAKHCCRFCPMSLNDFKKNPWKCLDLRTAEQYDECVVLAQEKWKNFKTKSLQQHQRRKELQALRGEKVSTTMISKNARKNLRAINHLGVKPIPSALNSLPNFHVSKDGLPSCLAHDLYQGIIDIVLIKILKHFIVDKEWFTLETLNRRITTFKCKCSDAEDAPTSIQNFDGVKGHACETWTFMRLIPFMIEDLIQDKEDDFWQLYLQLKEICEFVCAPQISERQVARLDHIIQLYLCNVQKLLPEALTPKHHYLRHYPTLILRFGPLIRLFTMRFESKHVFFKKVARMCHSFKNITHTQSDKYMYRFAHDQMHGIIPPDVVCEDEGKSLTIGDLKQDMYSALPPAFNFSQVTAHHELNYKGTYYKINMFMILDKCNIVDLYVGCIEKILLLPNSSVLLCLREHEAQKSFQGYFIVDQEKKATVRAIESLPDHYPLPMYLHAGRRCLSLKHSLLFL